MAFEGLTEKISSAFKHLRSKGRLTESDIKDAMKEIRMALLEADVNFKVAKDFIKTVTEKATDAEILESLSPTQQVIKIVNEELVSLLGGQTTRLTISPNPPTIVMMAGLQGAGKTTNCAKLAALLRKQQQRRPLLVACDVYRPARAFSHSTAARGRSSYSSMIRPSSCRRSSSRRVRLDAVAVSISNTATTLCKGTM